MKVTDQEIQWLELCFPNLQYQAKAKKIVGELDFCAYYDREAGKLITDKKNKNRERVTFIQDVFEIEIHLDSIDSNGWPEVYEIGGRHRKIVEKCKTKIIDLHVFSNNGACCLGIRHIPDRKLRVKNFILSLVIPFFYRLSYTEKFGITAARNDLWGEYSHGEVGQIEYIEELLYLAEQDLGRNSLCPCGSGKKYKKCHLEEVGPIKRHDAFSKEWRKLKQKNKRYEFIHLTTPPSGTH